jgi:hypothetical protein
VVTGKDGTRTAIPITATPIVARENLIERCCELSAHLASAGLKMASAMLQSPKSDILLSSLGPLERRVIERSHRALKRLVISRVDYFISGKPWALELNATIPAMAAYSDIAAESFIEAVGQLAGLPLGEVARLQRENGSNSRALYDALVTAFKEERGKAPGRIALLVRRGDPQITELFWLKARFEALGTQTDVVYPDELSGTNELLANGVPYDLVYRHLFVRRLEEIESPYLLDFFSHQPNPRAVLFNGPAAHVETKATFALLSRATLEPELAQLAGLTDEELLAIRESVSWTRALRNEPGTGPDGERLANVAQRVADNPDQFVIKRAWDYGGKAVFVGPSREEPSFQARVTAAYGQSLPWPELVKRAALDPAGGGFVAQTVVNPIAEKHWVCQGDGVVETDLYVDFSAYASVGLGRQPAWGAVCRGSPSRIVNIAGGGAVLPLVRLGVWDVLSGALRKR